MRTAPKASRTITANAGIEIEIRKSRFVCDIFRVASEAEAQAVLADARSRHWSANHHCSAWRIGDSGRLQRSNDDGEPAGTAGVPMLEALIRRDLTDVVAVVTRYFGGTRLGVGGLIRAYGASVSAAIEQAGIVERRPLAVTEVGIGHAASGRFEHAIRASGFVLAAVTYNPDDVTFTVHLDSGEVERFERWVAAISAGHGRIRSLGFVTVDVPVPS